MLPLTLTTQSYAWGVPASTESKVLSLARANGVKDAINPKDDTRFAELWVGTHPSGGSTLGGPNASDTTLESWLEQNPEALGTTLAQLRQPGHKSGRLPYIMKVLSIDKPLPLQAHPTADTAGEMHQQQPQLYPDDSHKPEMAICLISFCAFVGFLTYDKLSQELRRMPQLAAVFGDQNVQDYLAAGPEEDQQCARHKALAAMLSQLLLHTPPEVAQQTLAAVLKQLGAPVEESGPVLLTAGTQAAQAALKKDTSAQDSAGGETSTTPQDAPGSSSSNAPKVPTTGTSSAEFAAEAERLEGPTSGVCTACDLDIALGVITQQGGWGQRGAMISTAAAAWPDDDAGVLALLLMQDVVLERGEACLIPAGCPHAYICGEILEVQAASNNTIKGGLTSHGEPTDKQGLVDTVTASLLGTTGPTPPSGTSGDRGPTSGTLGDQAPGKLWEGPPQIVEPIVPGGATGSRGLSSIEGLLLYQPAVDEFQVWHLVIPGGTKGLDYVMDPGPGVLLVTGGAGSAVVKAGVVVSSALTDEAELHPGTAFFLPAGSSLQFSGRSTTEALDLWMTTANSRMFTAEAAAQHAAAPQGEDLAPGGSDIQGGGAGGSAEGQAGRHITVKDVQGSGADTGHAFTASEQVAAAVMAGAAGSSCPANQKDAAAASAADGAARSTLQGRGSAPMQTE